MTYEYQRNSFPSYCEFVFQPNVIQKQKKKQHTKLKYKILKRQKKTKNKPVECGRYLSWYKCIQC